MARNVIKTQFNPETDIQMLHLRLTVKEMSTLLSIEKNKQKKVSDSQFQSSCCETNTTTHIYYMF